MECPRQCHSAVCLDNYIIIFGGISKTFKPISTRVIWMYNLYTEEWSNHVISRAHATPKPFHGAVAAVIDGTIYTFGGRNMWAGQFCYRNELWTLNKAKREGFLWSFKEIQCKKESPSPRSGHTAWEYAGKLYTFGGWGDSPEGYLNEHGNFVDRLIAENNQLLCYDPTSQKWTDLLCLGTVPSPRSNHASATMNEKVWLFGGRDFRSMDDLFELTMHSLTWIKIQTGHPHPYGRSMCTLTLLTNNQIVLHGGFGRGKGVNETWIMDLASHSWRQYTSGRDHVRRCHTGASGLRSNAIIFGGLKDLKDTYEVYNIVFNVMLEPKCLQQLAMQIIYKNKDTLPWKFLPVKLISLLGISLTVTQFDEFLGTGRLLFPAPNTIVSLVHL